MMMMTMTIQLSTTFVQQEQPQRQCRISSITGQCHFDDCFRCCRYCYRNLNSFLYDTDNDSIITTTTKTSPTTTTTTATGNSIIIRDRCRRRFSRFHHNDIIRIVMVVVLFLATQQSPTTTTTATAFQCRHPQQVLHNNNNKFHDTPITTLRSNRPQQQLLQQQRRPREGGCEMKSSSTDQTDSNSDDGPQPRPTTTTIVATIATRNKNNDNTADPFVPYMRDIERVLNNHARIQQQQQRMNRHDDETNHDIATTTTTFNVDREHPPSLLFRHDDDDDDDLNESSSSGSNTQKNSSDILNASFYSWCNEQRRNKPALLLYDMDGAEKCIQMLRYLLQQQQSSSSSSSSTVKKNPMMKIPEYAFITIMKVLVLRGRLRWKRNSNNSNSNNNGKNINSSIDDDNDASSNNNNNNNHSNNMNRNSVIICAADQLEELLLDYESQSHNNYDDDNSSIRGDSGTVSSQQTPPLLPSMEMCHLVLQAYAICATPRGDRQYAQRAQSLLHRMEQQQQMKMKRMNHGDNSTSTTDFVGHSSTVGPAGNDDDNSNNSNPSTLVAPVAPGFQQYSLPVESYLHVLHAFAWQQGNLQSPVNGADTAYQLLQVIVNRNNNYATNNINDQRVNMQATIWVLEAYSKCRNGASQCNALLKKVKEYNSTTTTMQDGNVYNPDCTTTSTIGRQLFDAEVYSNAILAWSKAAVAAATTIEKIADEQEDDVNDVDDEDIIIGPQSVDNQSPTTTTRNATNKNHNDYVKQAAKNAHLLLLELVDHYVKGSFMKGSEPPLIAFNGVISAYSRLGQIDQAEEVLWLMERQVRPKCTHLVPNAISYNSILHGIHRQSQQEQQYSKRNNKNLALKRALSILSYMEENSKEQPEIRPNAFSYQTIMKCWLQCSGSDNHGGYSKEYIAEQAEQLLYKVEQLWGQGDTSFEYTNRIYNMMLNSYAKTYGGNRFLSNKAMDLLSRMKQSTHHQCQPDIISYTSTLECIAQSSDPMAPELADELLEEVKMRYATTNDAQLRPNLRTYTMSIQTLAQNNGNIFRARELLTELVQQYELSGYDPQLKPSTYPYNYVLNCAANTIDPDQRLPAFQIATQTYQEMRQSKILCPDSFSYAFWLKCCNNLLGPGPLRTKAIMYAFEECKRDGLVSNVVLLRLQQSCTKEIVMKLLELQQLPTQSSATDQTTTIQMASSKMMTTTINGVGTTAAGSTTIQQQPIAVVAVGVNDPNNNFIQQRRNNNNITPLNGKNKSSMSSSFRPIVSMDASGRGNTNYSNNNNNNNQRSTTNNLSSNRQRQQEPDKVLTISDISPFWSRNTVRSNNNSNNTK